MAKDTSDRMRAARLDPLLGSIFDRRYRIDARIAVGGFGAVYRATHVKSGHVVALKILHPQLASDPGVVARFRREGATLTTLRDPHTIIAYELGEVADGTLYIVMELLAGETLFERFRAHGPIEWKRMATIARGVCHSLAEAHGLGIVHRDLKPTNIHLEERDGDRDFVKVLDFGIAKIMSGSDFDASDLTNAGQMIGTLDYMSPEQMVGGACTGQSDIYVLGIVMYEMIAGRRPFAEAATPSAALGAMLRTRPTALALRAPIPAALDAIVMRCLERDPQQRYPDVLQLGADLDRLLGGHDALAITGPFAVEHDDSITHAVDVAPLDPRRVNEQDPPARGPAPGITVPSARGEAAPAAIPGGCDEAPTVLVPSGAGVASSRATGGPIAFARAPTPSAVAVTQNVFARAPTPNAAIAAPSVSGHVPTPAPNPMPNAPIAAPFRARAPIAAPRAVPGADRGGFDARPPRPGTQAPASPAGPLQEPPHPPASSPWSAPRAHTQTAEVRGHDRAKREAAMRRLIWIVVLSAGALLGVLVASQL